MKRISSSSYSIPEDVRFVPAEEQYCRSYLETINSVALEGKYLSNNTGFSYESIVDFYRYCRANGFPQFYVLDKSDNVVGWCDIVLREGQKPTAGYIGIGLLPEYRERGIGRALMLYAMDDAAKRGFTEIRLDCRITNKRAIHLYKKLGFRTTAIKRRGLCVDEQYIPIVCMRKKLRIR